MTTLESKIAAREPLTRAEAERVLASPDLVSIGMLGEAARKAKSGDVVTYGRVLEVAEQATPNDRGAAGEVRLIGRPASIEHAIDRVRAAVPIAAGVTLTGFSLADLVHLADSDHLALAALSMRLRAAGLEAVAEVPIDLLGDTENAVEVVRAVRHGGLQARRLTVARAALGDRLDLIDRAAVLQRETSAVAAFAPLPRADVPEAPSTGYDDVRTIAIARLMCVDIPAIQVDWPLYGPKLAQVAIAYGANDIDGVAAYDSLELGPRRSPKEDIERQIRAAFAVPAERDGRYGRQA